MTDNIDATYSPEDNKLRLYPVHRLDAETFARVKAAGFRWAPKQELFVAPKWTPAREDLCIELAGEIEPEEMTLAERAEIKAARLDGYAERRSREADTLSKAADDLSQAFYMGQPILVGHHSERKARKTQERMDNAMRKSVAAAKTSNYWLYRAEGVERFANMKNSAGVRTRRIATLLKELRDLQRRRNHYAAMLKMWKATTDEDAIKRLAGAYFASGNAASRTLREALERGEISPSEMRRQTIEATEKAFNSPTLSRWLDHVLKRIGFERSMLGRVAKFDGELTPAIIAGFLRTHGAEKPKAVATEAGFSVSSPVPLPYHISETGGLEFDAEELELDANGWRELMQIVGYVVPDKKDAKPPLLNFRADHLMTRNRYHGDLLTYKQIEMTKEQFKRIPGDGAYVCLSACGSYRFRSCPDPEHRGPYFSAPRVAVFLTDSKEHPAPDVSAEVENAA